MEEIWTKVSERKQSSRFGFYTSLQAGPLSCNTKNKRAWYLPNGKLLGMDEAFLEQIEKIRQEADGSNKYVESDDGVDFQGTIWWIIVIEFSVILQSLSNLLMIEKSTQLTCRIETV